MATKKQKEKIANWLLNPDNPGDYDLDFAEQQIKEVGLEKVYREIELPLVEVLIDMKKIGVRLDRKKLRALQQDFNRKVTDLKKKIYKEAGEEFNLNSPAQLLRVLNNKFRLNIKSTKAEILEKLRGEHKIADLILQYREAFKIKSTYIEPLLKLGDRAHTTLIQTGAATGRFSSQNPNLQNIPPVMKEVFIADPGYQLAAFDYSQLELRILAALSGDKKMIEAFQQGRDIHRLTASQVFNVLPEKVTKEMRRLAKVLNFGVVYGMGAAAFARASGLDSKQARRFIDEYFSDFEEIKKWQEKIKADARKRGYVENLNGRKRWLPALVSKDRYLAAEAERMAINMPVQSLGADIIKLAMIAAYKKFKKGDEVKLLLSVHDELLFEIKSDKVKEIMPEIKRLMENAYSLPGVQLEVVAGTGKNYGAI